MLRKTIYWNTFRNDWGTWLVAADAKGLIMVSLPGQKTKALHLLAKGQHTILAQKRTPILKKTEKQLREYLRGTRKQFSLPIHFQGTPFQQNVWKALQEIPYGKTESYGGIARKIRKPKAARAVGGANNKNPLPVVVPCHRIIGGSGNLVGFGGGLSLKKKLLRLESTT